MRLKHEHEIVIWLCSISHAKIKSFYGFELTLWSALKRWSLFTFDILLILYFSTQNGCRSFQQFANMCKIFKWEISRGIFERLVWTGKTFGWVCRKTNKNCCRFTKQVNANIIKPVIQLPTSRQHFVKEILSALCVYIASFNFNS